MLFRLQFYKILDIQLGNFAGESMKRRMRESSSPPWFHGCFGCKGCQINPKNIDEKEERPSRREYIQVRA